MLFFVAFFFLLDLRISFFTLFIFLQFCNLEAFFSTNEIIFIQFGLFKIQDELLKRLKIGKWKLELVFSSGAEKYYLLLNINLHHRRKMFTLLLKWSLLIHILCCDEISNHGGIVDFRSTAVQLQHIFHLQWLVDAMHK